MISYEDQCVGCPTELGCIGSLCKYKHVPVAVCDDCGDEASRLYEFDGEELCGECVLKRLPLIWNS